MMSRHAFINLHLNAFILQKINKSVNLPWLRHQHDGKNNMQMTKGEFIKSIGVLIHSKGLNLKEKNNHPPKVFIYILKYNIMYMSIYFLSL